MRHTDLADGQNRAKCSAVASLRAAYPACKSSECKTQFIETIQSDLGRPVVTAEIFRFPSTLNRCHLAPSRTPQEGRFAIVTDVGRGMQWTRWCRETSGAHAYGEVVWS
jgi:hypothetical protein